jgi:hypothetical protein
VSPFEIDFFSEAFLDNKRLHRPFLIYTPFGYTSYRTHTSQEHDVCATQKDLKK